MHRPTLHLMCGLPGSGKTTLAMRLERELPALRLCPDEWMGRILRSGRDEQGRAAVEEVQLEIALSVLQLGSDVILESGFWSRSERDRARSLAAERDAHVKIYFLDVPLEDLLQRTAPRNQSLSPHTFPVTEEEMRAWARIFEPPTEDELG